MGKQIPERFRAGDRVRVKWECTDGYVQPWRGRFEKGRVGTVVEWPQLGPNRVHVEWDQHTSPKRSGWSLSMHPGDLEKVET